jgi:hypothetical protein
LRPSFVPSVSTDSSGIRLHPNIAIGGLTSRPGEHTSAATSCHSGHSIPTDSTSASVAPQPQATAVVERSGCSECSEAGAELRPELPSPRTARSPRSPRLPAPEPSPVVFHSYVNGLANDDARPSNTQPQSPDHRVAAYRPFEAEQGLLAHLRSSPPPQGRTSDLVLGAGMSPKGGSSGKPDSVPKQDMRPPSRADSSTYIDSELQRLCLHSRNPNSTYASPLFVPHTMSIALSPHRWISCISEKAGPGRCCGRQDSSAYVDSKLQALCVHSPARHANSPLHVRLPTFCACIALPVAAPMASLLTDACPLLRPLALPWPEPKQNTRPPSKTHLPVYPSRPARNSTLLAATAAGEAKQPGTRGWHVSHRGSSCRTVSMPKQGTGPPSRAGSSTFVDSALQALCMHSPARLANSPPYAFPSFRALRLAALAS